MMSANLFEPETTPESWGGFADWAATHAPDALRDYYAHGFGDLELAVHEHKYVALDIETTGFDARRDRIVSIGAVSFDCQRIRLASAKHWLVDPGKLNDKSVVVHGITHSAVADAPPIQAVLSEVFREIQGRTLVVHFRAMEREFFRQLGIRNWNIPILFPLIDTFEMERHFLRLKQTWWHRLLGTQVGSLRLPDVRQHYHLPDYENHNALTDALATAELFQAMVQKHQLANSSLSHWIM